MTKFKAMDYSDKVVPIASSSSTQEIDYDKMKAVPIVEVLEEIGATLDSSTGRWSMPDETHTAGPKLALDKNNGWVHHKTCNGGDTIALVRFWQNGDFDNYQDPDSRAYKEAARWMAEHFDGFISYGNLATLAGECADEVNAFNDPEKMLQTLRDGSGSKRLEQVKAYCEATGLELDRLSLTFANGAVGIAPASPYLGQEIMLKGWGTNATNASIGTDTGAGRLVVLDFDGTKEDEASGIKALKPSIQLVNKILDSLKSQGYPACAVEFSTMGPDAVRSKIHVTFKCEASQRVKTVEDHTERYDLLADKVREIVAGMEATGEYSEEEIAALGLDNSMRQASRLKRLAGHPKKDAQNSIIVARTDSGAFVDWQTLWETRPQTLDISPLQRYTFGETMRLSTWATDEDGKPIVGQENKSKSYTIAKNVYPLEILKDRDTGQRGVRLRLQDDMGRVHHNSIALAAFVDASVRTDELKRLADISIIRPGKAQEFIKALDYWRQSNLSTVESTSTQRQGWQREGEKLVYVNGSTCYGADWIVKGKAAEKRSAQHGTMEEWKAGIAELIAPSKGLLLALGQSLAGPLVYPTGQNSYFLHVHGESSVGKTTALKAGVSIWGNPAQGQYTETWRTTSNKLELTAMQKSGALLALDELKELGDDQKAREDLRKIIMMIASGRGKGRMTQSAEAKDDFTWSLSALSTGENSMSDWLGDLQQGGESVRALDLHVESGDLATDADHAADIEEWAANNYGHAGPAFAGYIVKDLELAEITWRVYADRLRALTDDKEFGRVCDSIALIWAALDLAIVAKVLPSEITKADTKAAILWAVERIKQGRGALTSPNARALAGLQDLITTQPALFPIKDAYGKGYGSVYGISMENGEIKTCETMLKASGICSKAGIGPREFLAWLADNDLADAPDGPSRINGLRKSWHTVYPDGKETPEEAGKLKAFKPDK